MAKTKGKIGKELEKLEGNLQLTLQEEAYYAKKNEFGLLCLYQELNFFHHYKSTVSAMFQDFIHVRAKYISQVGHLRYSHLLYSYMCQIAETQLGKNPFGGGQLTYRGILISVPVYSSGANNQRITSCS